MVHHSPMLCYFRPMGSDIVISHTQQIRVHLHIISRVHIESAELR